MALDPGTLDLADLALALEDHAPDHRWWLDPRTGEVEPRFGGGEEAAARGLVPVDPLPTAVGYRDMQDFVALVRDPRARHLLGRAIVGRGAFRRFKDALLDWPELRRAWFAFHDARGERRAIAWLAERGLVDAAAAEAALARRPEPGPEDVPGLLDARGIVRRIAGELRRMYAGRLREVVLTGAWAHGDPHPESPIELLVVLERVVDPWQEKRRMDRVAWRYSIRHDTVVCLLPVAAAELATEAAPLLARLQAEEAEPA